MAQLDRFPLYPEEAAARPARVCVTGITGYLAGPIVARLLASGHTVHGTCRDPSAEPALEHLRALPGAGERLKLFAADLLKEGSFDTAVQGCDYVIHTASPYNNGVPKARARAELIEPAVRGTQNVLGAVARAPTVRSVVLTSSVAAVYGNPHERGASHVFTEEDWNCTASETVLPYFYSKKLAEERAWELAKGQDRWRLVTINPGVVLGPPMAPRKDSESVQLLLRLLRGHCWPAVPHMGFGMVDVRDVAAAHCLAMVHPAAQGRYLLVSRSMTLRRVCLAIKAAFPSTRFRPPRSVAPKWLLAWIGPWVGLPYDLVTHAVGMVPRFDGSKATKELGIQYTPLEESIRDQVEAMQRLGLVGAF